MSRPVARIALGALVVLAVAPLARGQNPVPRVPDVTQRSGLVSRMVPITPHLPPDPKRDDYYNTYWNDGPKPCTHPDLFCHSGLYGNLLIEKCTLANSNFWGNPSPPAPPACKPVHPVARWWENFAHPFRPVGYYYVNGAYAPIYDLDPLVTGPGPFPWPVFFRRCIGG